MLLPASRTSRHLSHRAVLALALVGVAIGLLPRLRDAPVQAQDQKDAVANKAKERIYVSASIEYIPEGRTSRRLVAT